MVRLSNRLAAAARIRAEAGTSVEGARRGTENDAQEQTKRTCSARVRFLVTREHSRFAFEPRLTISAAAICPEDTPASEYFRIHLAAGASVGLPSLGLPAMGVSFKFNTNPKRRRFSLRLSMRPSATKMMFF